MTSENSLTENEALLTKIGVLEREVVAVKELFRDGDK